MASTRKRKRQADESFRKNVSPVMIIILCLCHLTAQDSEAKVKYLCLVLKIFFCVCLSF